MKRALIDPNGNIAQVEPLDFPVAAPFFWTDCPDGCLPYDWFWDGSTVRPSLPPTPDQIQAMFTSAVQAHMDAAARSRGFDDIKSAVTYADEPAVPSFQADGQRFRAWRSLSWQKCYEVMAAVRDGTRPIPSSGELLSELPTLLLT